ncbi:uncharacterized protein LOC127241301 [Andrographis paniculata]|uniref:uncharacterized protein LOC127241301 n=1 Tax=Andrographis paniculata TaxID=175694 RepID=UPI0021E7BE45|nr:uncharacterized protein LOC127241301 [Andrographis paniculata]
MTGMQPPPASAQTHRMNTGGGAAPTGCYKCGRPGHWSRDCPSNPTSVNGEHPNPPISSNPEFNSNTASRSHLPTQKPKPKPKPPRRTRPKLTPDLLLSDAGIGHILRYFPKALKCRGRGHEVNDLQHLLHLYAEWHSRLLPYYNFDQFIHKVEQVATTKRFKVCLRNLQEKVATGEDPTKLHEPQDQQTSFDEQGASGSRDIPSHLNEGMIDSQEDMARDIWEAAVADTSTREPLHPVDTATATDTDTLRDAPEQRIDNNAGASSQSQMSEEQKARMEANKLKALERAAARSRAARACVSSSSS